MQRSSLFVRPVLLMLQLYRRTGYRAIFYTLSQLFGKPPDFTSFFPLFRHWHFLFKKQWPRGCLAIIAIIFLRKLLYLTVTLVTACTSSIQTRVYPASFVLVLHERSIYWAHCIFHAYLNVYCKVSDTAPRVAIEMKARVFPAESFPEKNEIPCVNLAKLVVPNLCHCSINN